MWRSDRGATLGAPRLNGRQALYYTSRLASQIGQGVFFAYLVVVAGPFGDGGAFGLGSVIVAMTVAALTLGPLGGGVVDRIGPRFALVVGAVLRVGALTAGLVLLQRGDLAWAIAFGYSAASQLFSPAELALVPAIGRRRPAGVHASLFALQFGGQAVGGFMLAPLFYLLGAASGMLFGAIILYAIVAAVAALLARELGPVVAGAGERERSGLRIGRTLRFFGHEPRALYAVGVLAFFDVATKVLMVSAPVYLKTELDLSGTQIVMLAVTGGSGAVIGLGWAARGMSAEVARPAMRWVLAAPLVAMFALAPLGYGVSTLSIADTPLNAGWHVAPLIVGTVTAFPAAFLLGLSTGAVSVVARTVLTATAPLGHHGRVFAAEAVLSQLFVIPGLLLAGLATDLVSARATLVAMAIIGTLLLVLLELVNERHEERGRRAEAMDALMAAHLA